MTQSRKPNQPIVCNMCDSPDLWRVPMSKFESFLRRFRHFQAMQCRRCYNRMWVKSDPNDQGGGDPPVALRMLDV